MDNQSFEDWMRKADSILEARAQVTNSTLDILSDEQKIALTPILEITLKILMISALHPHRPWFSVGSRLLTENGQII